MAILDVLTGTPPSSGLVRIQGPLSIIADPSAGGTANGNVTVANTLTVSGSVSAVSGLAISGNITATNNLIVSGSLSALSGASITNGFQFDQVNGGPASSTTISQLLSAASSTITMTGSGRVIFLNPTATESTCILTPTSSAVATAATYTNGMEVLLVNLHPSSASTITIPTGSAGANQGIAITISGGNSAKLIYVAALQTWVHIV
jgi:hypothetical protein